MKPTPEQIAAMEARGWTHDDGAFTCGGGLVAAYDDVKLPAINGTIRWSGAWRASYGTAGRGYDTFRPHPTPEDAADEAEEWFRHAVRGLPGLEVPQ